MGDVDVKSWPKLKISQIPPLEIARISRIAPAAVHIKELNHIDPISVESLRIDEVRNIDPVRVEQFDVTHLPTVNVSVSRFPSVDLNVRRVPPVAIAVHQEFAVPSQYTVHAQLLGVEVMRLQIHGQTRIAPLDRTRRERVKTHERSYPDVAALGNPGIPTKRIERSAGVVTRSEGRGRREPVHRGAARRAWSAGWGPHGMRAGPAPDRARALGGGGPSLSAGRPQFSYSIAERRAGPSESHVGGGG